MRKNRERENEGRERETDIKRKKEYGETSERDKPQRRIERRQRR